jgi:hypothetical protein
MEHFAIARLMLFEAHEMSNDPIFYDIITQYKYRNDAALYGIRSAKLKLAYESAYNVLDKLALFLNDYLELGIGQKQVNFSNIWSEKIGSSHAFLRPKLLERQNEFIFALYDLACDFGKDVRGKDGDWSHYKATRHLLTHRYLVLHEKNWESEDGSEYHRTWDDMIQDTESLLYVTRNALLYLFMAVQLEEREQSGKPNQKK